MAAETPRGALDGAEEAEAVVFIGAYDVKVNCHPQSRRLWRLGDLDTFSDKGMAKDSR
jgi:hypothetical protein